MERGDSLSFDFERKREILSVSALNREARRLLEQGLGTVWVEGEISNLARPSSGHLYWSLKDGAAQVRCAMFRQANRGLGFAPENGQQVLVRARVSLYEARGEYQLLVDLMEEAGEGLLRRRFEALKRKLAAEGLFDEARKRSLPPFPEKIGVVTSPTGAALRDVLISLRRRFPATRVTIYPTSVQGEGAAEEIVRALRLADARGECDLLILTRGGGSLEDLWSFNEEIVARAVAAVGIPIIVGVGHEIDFTIADFAADVRAPTPSQAAELAVPEQTEVISRLDAFADRLSRLARQSLREPERAIEALTHRLGRTHPGVILAAKAQRLDEFEGRLLRGFDRTLAEIRASLDRLGARINVANPRVGLRATRERLAQSRLRLHRGVRKLIEQLTVRTSLAERGLTTLSPLATLERGFAIVSRRDDGSIVRTSSRVSAGTEIDIRLAEGGLGATVDHVDASEE